MKIATTIRMPRIYILFAFLILCSALRAQPAGGKWTAAGNPPILTNGRLVFADSLIGYYIGQDTGYVTKDGGVTWNAMTFPSNARPAPTFLFAPDRNTIISFQAYAVDSNGVKFPGIIKSTDMGSTWSLIDANQIPSKVNALKMWSANDGFRIWEDDITQKDLCAVTHDGGKTFSETRGDATLQKYLTKLSNVSISIKADWSDSVHGAIAVSGSGANPVLLTSDGGRTWTEHYLKFKGDSTLQLSFVYMFPGTSSIWVIPADAKVARFYYYSSDFGSTWVISDTIKSGYIIKLAPSSKTGVWAFNTGSPNEVFLTANCVAYDEISTPWKFVDTLNAHGTFNGPAFAISDIEFIDADHGWIRAIKQSLDANKETLISDTAFIFRFAAPTPSSVKQTSEYTRLRCIPNPASSSVKVEGFAGDERVLGVRLTDALGKQYVCTPENSGAEIGLDIRPQASGCYFITVTTSLRTENIPVMIMHY